MRRRPPRRSCAAALLGVVALGAVWGSARAAPGDAGDDAAAAAAGARDVVEAWTRARTEAPSRLRAHVAWCREQKAGRERLAACERLLALVPDDADARRALRFVRVRDGVWKRLPPENVADTPPEIAAAAAARLAEALEPLRAAARAVWESESVPIARREQALEDRVAADPDDEAVRAASRETRSGDRWVLEETARALERAAELRKSATELRAKHAKPDVVAATEEETFLAGKVAGAFTGPAARVVGAAGTAEARDAATAACVVRELWDEALGEPNLGGALRFVLFPDAAAGHAAVDRDTSFDGEDRAYVKTLGSGWRPRTDDCLVWSADPRVRVETVLRQTAGKALQRRFKVGTKQGWAWEGIGHWASEVVLGTHQVVFVRRSEYADPAAEKSVAERLAALRGAADWSFAARDLAARTEWPGLRSVLGKDTNSLSPDETLVSYAFARYLIEGRPDALPGVLRDAGAVKAPDAWVESRLDASVEGMDRRLRRWLAETVRAGK